jgi:hypothetical protein
MINRAHREVSRAGVSLRAMLGRGSFSVGEVVALGRSLMEALVRLHENKTVHGNLRPDNVYTSRDEGFREVVLRGAGLRQEPAEWPDPLEAARYMSPEQAGLLKRSVDERTDLYSAGILLYECLAGTCPFSGTSLGEVFRQHISGLPRALTAGSGPVPSALEDIILHLIHRDPADRYHTAQAALHDLCVVSEALGRGDTEPYVVVGRLDKRSSLTEPCFVGRRTELKDLDGCLQSAARGQGGLVLVEAESGGGKTRLLRELERHAALRHGWTAWGQALDEGAQRPFQILVGLAQALIDGGQASPALAERLGVHADAVVDALPELGSLLGAEKPAELGPEGFGQVRSLEALTQFLEALGSEERPAVLIFDDCQWADEFGLRLLNQFQEKRRNEPSRLCHVLVVAAFRSEEVSPDNLLRRIVPEKHLILRPLGEEEVTDLLESMAGPLPTQIPAIVTKHSAGSPFMAAAVLRGLVEWGREAG